MATELRVWPPSVARPAVPATDGCYRVAADVSLERTLNVPATLAIPIEDWRALFDSEADPVNAVQTRAYAEYAEDHIDQSTGVTAEIIEFRGRAHSVLREYDSGGAAIAVTLKDKMAVLQETYAIRVVDGVAQYVWMRETPSVEYSHLGLWPGHDYGDGFRWIWWPRYGASSWLSTGVSITTKLAVAITGSLSGASVKLGASTDDANAAAAPLSGWFSVNDGAGHESWFQYNGKSYNPSDGYWYAHNCYGPLLDSSAVPGGAGYAVNTDLIFRLSKRLHSEVPIVVEGYTGTAWEQVVYDAKSANFEDGSLPFPQDPLSYRASGTYTQMRVSAGWFDEEGAGVLTLKALCQDLLEVPAALGGPGFALGGSETCRPDIDATINAMVLTRVRCETPTNLFDFLSNLFSQLGLLKGLATDAIGWWYDSPNDKLCIKSLSQNPAVSADRHYTECKRYSEETTLEDVPTAVLVNYQQGMEINLLSSERCWHTPTGAPPGGAVPYVNQLVSSEWQGVVSLFYPGPQNCTKYQRPGPPEVNCQLLFDNDQTSGMALMWDSAPTAGTRFYAWFPGASLTQPDTFLLDKVLASFDIIGLSPAAPNEFDVRVMYYDDFTGSTSGTDPAGLSGAAKPLSALLRQRWPETKAGDPGYNDADYVLQAAGLMVNAQAVALHFDGYLNLTGGLNKFGFILKELRATGWQQRQVLVTLTGAYTAGDTTKLVAPLTAAKLIDATMGQYKLDPQPLDIGPATRALAANFGWLYLLGKLASIQGREYGIDSDTLDRQGLAQVAESLNCDGFTGLADYVRYDNVGGARELTARLTNFRNTLLGAGK